MDSGILREQLFPDIRPYAAGTLSVDSRHTLYWEQCGNPGGTPIVFIHGGPGAGAAPTHRRFFDPSHYRIIIFDQRGCGRSKPFADIVDNTTDHLVADLDALRRHLSIDKWILFGGSWGATLALAYGAKWPERCAGFILRGVFLGTKREMEWFLFGMGKFFPEARRQFRERLPEEERDDLLANYHRRLVHPNEKVHGPAAAAWVRYESTCSSLVPKWSHSYSGNDPSALALARIEAHYFVNAFFLNGHSLLDGLGGLQGIPSVIVQGRYDMVCPIETADRLARHWPRAEYIVVPTAGHSALEPGICSALVRSTEWMKSRVQI
ncbi:MAG: prolyl aminopeptidase [Rhodospirillales bacterium]|nr:prolyl aminopeptidase [Rhodospirillales bacterium]